LYCPKILDVPDVSDTMSEGGDIKIAETAEFEDVDGVDGACAMLI